MEKAAEAFRTISEVALELDVPKHVLRFWEGKFPQVKPMKRGGGRRYYRPDDVILLRGIRRLLYEAGYTIKGVQKVIRDQGLEFVKTTGTETTGDAVERPLAVALSDKQADASATDQVLGGTVIAPVAGMARKGRVEVAGSAPARTPRGKAHVVAPVAPEIVRLGKGKGVGGVGRRRGSDPAEPASAARAGAVGKLADIAPSALSAEHLKRLRQARRELEICLHLLASDADDDEETEARPPTRR